MQPQQPDEEDQINARRVLQSKSSGVIGEGDIDADQQMVRLANIHNVIFPWGGYWVWWTITLMGAVATAFFLPYGIAFQEEHRSVLDVSSIVDMILNAVFTIDIVVCFNLAFYSKDDRLVFDRSIIARTYLKKMFMTDLCGVFPFEEFFLLITGNISKSTSHVLLFSLLKLTRLVRLHRLKKMSEILQYDGHISFLWFTLLRNLTAVLLVAHWEACTMYFIARYRSFDEETWLGPLVAELGSDYSNFDYYLTSLYLSVVTFCTVGTGDSSFLCVFETNNANKEIVDCSQFCIRIATSYFCDRHFHHHLMGRLWRLQSSEFYRKVDWKVRTFAHLRRIDLSKG